MESLIYNCTIEWGNRQMANQKQSSRKSRIEKHAKKKKENFILNILIGVVFILVIIVGANILLNNDTKATVNENQSEQKATEKENVDDKAEKNESKESSESEDTEADSSSEPTDENANATEDEKTEDEKTEDVTEDQESEEDEEENEIIYGQSEDPNVDQVMINQNWKPIGTVQTGDHISSYDKGTTDREEMEKAMEYATGVSVDNMIVWWIGNGGKPNENVVGTISNKDKSQIYRVYMDWVDGQGWKPTKVEKLKSIDR